MRRHVKNCLQCAGWRVSAMASPRGGPGWTCTPHFCQRLFLRLMQIWRVFTGITELHPEPRYWLALRIHRVCPPHIFWTGNALVSVTQPRRCRILWQIICVIRHLNLTVWGVSYTFFLRP